MYKQAAQGRTATVFQRIEALEANVAGHEKGYGVRIDRLHEDVRFLAGVLGVTLPSDEPRAVNDYEESSAPYRN